MYIVYAQWIGDGKLVTYNQFASVQDWRKEMVEDGFTEVDGVSVLRGDAGKVQLLAQTNNPTKAHELAIFGNRLLRFAGVK